MIRFRPILMTFLATFLDLLPMAIGLGRGSEITDAAGPRRGRRAGIINSVDAVRRADPVHPADPRQTSPARSRRVRVAAVR